MKGTAFWVLLAVSLALNFGLAGGALYYKMEAERLGRGTAQGLEEVARRLALDDRQRADFAALRDRFQALRAEAMPSRDARRAAFLAELAKPQLDPARIAEIMDDGRDERQAFIQGLMGDLHALLATLSPDQRREFLAMAEEPQFLRALLGFGPGRDDPRAEAKAQAQK